MEKTLLIAGKELPNGDNLASGAVTSGRKAFITKNHTDEALSAPNGTVGVIWNRPSALSARSLVLKALNEGGHLDECMIVFDEKYYIEKYGRLSSTAENVRVIEELISSYQYLTMEVITRVSKKNKLDLATEAEPERRKLRLIFVHKPNPSIADVALGKATDSPSTVFISTAAAAFKTYAENVTATLVDNEEIEPLLISCDSTNELASNDNALSTWIFSYIETIENMKKNLTAKQKLTWIKAGSKAPTGFGFFG